MSETVLQAKCINSIKEIRDLLWAKNGYGYDGAVTIREFTRNEWEKCRKSNKRLDLCTLDALKKRGFVRVARVEEFTKVVPIEDTFDKATNKRTKVTQEIKCKRYFYELNMDACKRLVKGFKEKARWVNCEARRLSIEIADKNKRLTTLNSALCEIDLDKELKVLE